jgi:putative ABC transport system ATP-binding protein
MIQGSSICIKELRVTYNRWGQKVTALNGLNLTVDAGEWLFLLGHNGSGKSTLLSTINGSLNFDSGSILIDNTVPTNLLGRVFYIYQNPLRGTDPNLTLFENLYVADDSEASNVTSKVNLKYKYVELLQNVGLANRLNHQARALSGGERQLLTFCIARCRSAPLLLLDEPLSALDPEKVRECVEQIRLLHVSGRTVIQVTHDPELALAYGTRIVVLRDGQIVEDISPELADPVRIGAFMSRGVVNEL